MTDHAELNPPDPNRGADDHAAERPATDQIQAVPPDESPSPAGRTVEAALPVEGEARYCLRCRHRLRPFRLHELEQPHCPECRLPYDPANPSTYETRPTPRRTLFWLAVAGLVALYGTVAYACVFFMDQSSPEQQLGTALFLAVPFSVGGLLGYLVRPGIWLSLLLGLFGVTCIASLVLCMGLHGMFCGATLAGIFIGPALVGACAGWLLRVAFYNCAWDGRRYFFLLGLAALPFATDLAERHLFPLGIVVAEVRTEEVFPAPPQPAWDSIVFYEQVEHEPPWLLRLALPRPVRAEGSRAAVGDVTRCVYQKGHLVKRITERVEAERLEFLVIEQHLHFERDVTLLDGAFLLEPIDAQQTRVVLTTRYVRHLRPAWLWEGMERAVVHGLHRHVLEGMKRRLQEEEPDAPYFPRSPDLVRAKPK